MKAWQKEYFATKPWVLRGWKQPHRIATFQQVVFREHKNGKVRSKAAIDKRIMPQAAAVFAKFGGARALYRALLAVGRPRNPASIYKWSYPFPKGTGGLIPASAWKDILVAAKHEGIYFKHEDIAPTAVHEPNPHTPPARNEKKPKKIEVRMTALEELEAIRQELRTVHPFLAAKLRSWRDKHIRVLAFERAIPIHELAKTEAYDFIHPLMEEVAAGICKALPDFVSTTFTDLPENDIRTYRSQLIFVKEQ